MRSKRTRHSEVKDLILKHVYNNIKEYVILIIIFFIGLILGIIFINNIKEEQQTEINNYITNFTNSLKENASIDKGALLKSSIQSNLITALLLWFSGSTVIGMPIVYGIIGYRGFCLGYSISSIVATLETKSGILFCFSSMFFHNLLLIPAILMLAVSGIKLYQSIMKDRRKENIKLEIYRHTILAIAMSLILILCSFVEVYISSNLTCFFIKYI